MVLPALLERMVQMVPRGPLALPVQVVPMVRVALPALLALPVLRRISWLNRRPNRPEPLGRYPDSMPLLQIKEHPRGR